jgi:hypothetical protein
MIATPVELVHMLYCLRKPWSCMDYRGRGACLGWIYMLVQTFVILIGGIFSFAAIPYFNKRRIISEEN